jgi:hypothetical protein
MGGLGWATYDTAWMGKHDPNLEFITMVSDYRALLITYKKIAMIEWEY